MIQYEFGKVLYENPLARESDIQGFRLEGNAAIGWRPFLWKI